MIFIGFRFDCKERLVKESLASGAENMALVVSLQSVETEMNVDAFEQFQLPNISKHQI